MTRILVALVRLYPAAFRRQFGAEIERQVAADLTAARRRGPLNLAWRGLCNAANIVASALAERWRPTWYDGAVQPGFLHDSSRLQRAFDGWRQDLKHAARGLRRAPGFAAVTTATLALAMGLTLAMFTIVNAVLLQPLPYGDADRLLFITGDAPGSDVSGEFGLGTEFYVHFRERARTIEDFATFGSFTSTMRTEARVERLRMASGNVEMFRALAARPQLGRLPIESDRNDVALISDGMWQSWFGRDPAVVGRTFQISGRNRLVIGVMAADFRFPSDGTMVWFPAVVTLSELTPGEFGVAALARMKPGVTKEQVQSELTALARELPARFAGPPEYVRLMQHYRIIARPISEQLFSRVTAPLSVLFGGALMVLLIACANVANLFTVRAEGRLREMAVRQAMGAVRGQLARVQLSESLLLAGGAGLVAIGLAYVALPWLLRAVPAEVPRIGDATIGFAAVAFAFATTILVALACGLAPAFRASRPRVTWLREGGRGATRQGNWSRDGLVVAQTALTLVLLIGSGLLVRSYANLNGVHRGFDIEDIFTFQFAPEQPALATGPSTAQFLLDFMDRVRALPGVQAVGVVENVPLDEGTSTSRFRPEGAPPGAGSRLSYTFSGGDHFKALGVKVLAGRPFSREDAVGMLGNVVISKSAAAALWPDQDPIGKRLQRDGWTTWETVVGVVDDVTQLNFRDQPQATVYLPMTGHTPTQYRLTSPGIVVRTSRADAIAPEIRAIVKQVAPEAPMYRAYTMEFLASRAMGSLSVTMLALGMVSAMALILGALGVYGVLSYVVAQRTPEIGIRMALGAAPRGVRWMVVGQGLKVVALGTALGVGVAVLASKALGSLLFGVESLDALTFVAMSASMLVIGVLASYLPARRASNVDPIQSLR